MGKLGILWEFEFELEGRLLGSCEEIIIFYYLVHDLGQEFSKFLIVLRVFILLCLLTDIVNVGINATGD